MSNQGKKDAERCLSRLRRLPDSWFDGEGQRYSNALLNRFRRVLVGMLDSGLQCPRVYPNPDAPDTLSLEWYRPTDPSQPVPMSTQGQSMPSGTIDVSMTVALRSGECFLHALDLTGDRDACLDLNAWMPGDMARVVELVMRGGWAWRDVNPKTATEETEAP